MYSKMLFNCWRLPEPGHVRQDFNILLTLRGSFQLNIRLSIERKRWVENLQSYSSLKILGAEI